MWLRGLSCLMYYIIDTTIAVFYSFKRSRSKALTYFLNLTSIIWMGYFFHLRDTLLSASKSLKTCCIRNCLSYMEWSFQHEKCTAHVLICDCQADTYATLVQLDRECDCMHNECVYKKLSLKADNSCIVSFK